MEHVFEEEVEELGDESLVTLHGLGAGADGEKGTEGHVASVGVELVVCTAREQGFQKRAIHILEEGDIRFLSDTTDVLGHVGGGFIVAGIEGRAVGVANADTESAENGKLFIFTDVDEFGDGFDSLGAELRVGVAKAGTESFDEAGKLRSEVGGDEHSGDLSEDFEAHGAERRRLVVVGSGADEELPQVGPGVTVVSGELGGKISDSRSACFADSVRSFRITEAIQET